VHQARCFARSVAPRHRAAAWDSVQSGAAGRIVAADAASRPETRFGQARVDSVWIRARATATDGSASALLVGSENRERESR
jgi:hypothetical protein